MNLRVQDIRAGMADLKAWLHDVMHMGMAELASQPKTFWEETSARITDAKARGIANRIMRMQKLFEEPQWQEKVLLELGQLYLLTEAFVNIETLPELLQTDILTHAGVSIPQKAVLEGTGIKDQWLVMGKCIEKDVLPRLDQQRIWLRGNASHKDVMLLDHSFNKIGFPHNFLPGAILLGEMVPYPETYPLRAALRTPVTFGRKGFMPKGFSDLEEMIDSYSSVLAENPFLPLFPGLIHSVTFHHEKGEFYGLDTTQNLIPFSADFDKNWELLSISGGHPVSLFGEWNGLTFLPLSTIANNNLISLS